MVKRLAGTLAFKNLEGKDIQKPLFHEKRKEKQKQKQNLELQLV